jgi:hypothetical protein
MQHIVSLSGGTASAVAADRVLTRYGHDATTLPRGFVFLLLFLLDIAEDSQSAKRMPSRVAPGPDATY